MKETKLMSSVFIAKLYSIRHDNILRKIRTLMEKNSEEFNLLNFKKSEYDAQRLKNGVLKKQPCYLMTKEAVFLLTRNMKPKKEISEFCGNIIVEKSDRFEESFYKKLSEFLEPLNIEIDSQKIVGKYRLDFYLPKYNLAIEYDENQHKYSTKKDIERMEEITEKINCKWVRLDYKNTDAYNLGCVANFIYSNIKGSYTLPLFFYLFVFAILRNRAEYIKGIGISYTLIFFPLIYYSSLQSVWINQPLNHLMR